jgi:hypothetical protein
MNTMLGRIFKTKEPILSTKEAYNFLVVAALQEELSAFTEQTSKLTRIKKLSSGAVEYIYKKSLKKNYKILTYTSNKMGMAYNGAAIMRVIMQHQPIFIFFIGTYAGLNSEEQNAGDVLVPHFIYNYESGKHNENGEFKPDHICLETDEEVRKYAEIIKKKVDKEFNVFTDENFCSGSAVVDNIDKRKQIVEQIPRKVTGLDMEAYSLACINNILKEEGKKVSVVKGIMDFGQDKTISEKAENKTKAKVNSAKFTLALIEYVEENVLNVSEVFIE